jgi:hypothetical protein
MPFVANIRFAHRAVKQIQGLCHTAYNVLRHEITGL